MALWIGEGIFSQGFRRGHSQLPTRALRSLIVRQQNSRIPSKQEDPSIAMNYPAEALFGILLGGLNASTKTLASRVRALVGPEKLSVQQHQELESIIKSEFESLVWYVLGRFDNVGCTLPPAILGYDLIVNPAPEESAASELRRVNIREGEQDYSDMWLDYLFQKGQRQ
jgi:hypothetical protein